MTILCTPYMTYLVQVDDWIGYADNLHSFLLVFDIVLHVHVFTNGLEIAHVTTVHETFLHSYSSIS